MRTAQFDTRKLVSADPSKCIGCGRVFLVVRYMCGALKEF